MTISLCPHCGLKPEFVKSDSRYYKFLLIHGDQALHPNISPCSYPVKYGAVIYHHSKKDCIRMWNTHVERLIAEIGGYGQV